MGTIIKISLCFFLLSACVTTEQKKPSYYDDPARAELLPKAEQGDKNAQFELGQSLCCGLDENKNTQEATKWLCEAARANHTQAQFELAKIYIDPETRDNATTLMWLQVAASRNHKDATKLLEKIWENTKHRDHFNADVKLQNWQTAACTLNDVLDSE